MEPPETDLLWHGLMGKTIAVTTWGGNKISGKLIEATPNTLRIEEKQGISIVFRPSIASVFIKNIQD